MILLSGARWFPVHGKINTLPQRPAGGRKPASGSFFSRRGGAVMVSAMLTENMDPVELPPSHQVRCDGCSQITPSYDIVHYGTMEQGYRHLCGRCFNTEVAQSAGLEDFEHAQFQAVGLVDCTGELHVFHFRTHLFGAGVALDAFELRDGCPAGYQFQIIGDPKGDLLVLLGRLIEKMRRALSSKHLTDDEHGPQIADHRVVRGRIEWDDNRGDRVPLLVIDGREIHWDEFGRMLMSFEGSQFKLNIADKSDEL
jgi:hypothetical protein